MAGRGAGTRIVVLVVVVLVLGGGALLYARSRSEAPSVGELAEREGTCARLFSFSALIGDPRLSPSSPGATVPPQAVSDILTRMGGELDLLVESAPGEVSDDVRTLVGALRDQPRDPAAIRSPAFASSSQRLAGYIADPRNGCQTGSGSGDG